MAKVIEQNLREAMGKARDVIFCDFTRFDELRQVVKESVKEIQLGMPPAQRMRYFGSRKGCYRSSMFYVGRRVTFLRFQDIQVPLILVNRVRMRVTQLYPEYEIHSYDHSKTLSIYVRGTRRLRRK